MKKNISCFCMYRKLSITRFFWHLIIFGILLCCRLLNIFLTQFWTVKLLIHKPQPRHNLLACLGPIFPPPGTVPAARAGTAPSQGAQDVSPNVGIHGSSAPAKPSWQALPSLSGSSAYIHRASLPSSPCTTRIPCPGSASLDTETNRPVVIQQDFLHFLLYLQVICKVMQRT